MQRPPHFGELLVVTGVAVWLGATPPPVMAQAPKSGAEAKPATKEAQDVKGVPRISLLRIQVAKPQPPQANAPPGFPRRGRFGFPSELREGTTLTFLVEDPDRLIESVESKDCRITKFRDDKDTNLLEDEAAHEGDRDGAPTPPGLQASDGAFEAEVNPGGRHATVSIHSPRLPASSATKILLEANLVLKYSRGEKTVEQKNVNLKLDKITAGPYPLIIATQSDAGLMFGRQGGMQAGTQVILYHQGPLLGVKKVAFIGPDGNEIQSRISGSGSSGSLHQTYYQLTGKVETCTIRVVVPDVVETATIAISVNTGVGIFPACAEGSFPPPSRKGRRRMQHLGDRRCKEDVRVPAEQTLRPAGIAQQGSPAGRTIGSDLVDRLPPNMAPGRPQLSF